MIEHLIGKPEDIARFDFALILDKRDVDADGSDERLQPKVPHVFTSDLCHDLVLWAWSRTADQVRLSSATVDACHDFGKKMCKKYSSDCPIVNSMEQKIKLARLATALACRLFSCDKTGQKVIVSPGHVEFIYNFLNTQYDVPQFGFDVYSKRIRSSESIRNVVEIEELLTSWDETFLFQLIDGYQITAKFIEESTGVEYLEAKINLSKLLRNGCLTKHHNFFVKTPAFIQLLKEFVEKPVERKVEF